MSQYIKFNFDAICQNQEVPAAKVAKVGKKISHFSHFSHNRDEKTHKVGEVVATSISESCTQCRSQAIYVNGPVRVCKACKTDWLLPCPQCEKTHWSMPCRQWRCKTCGHTLLSYVDTRRTAPTSTCTILHPDGHEMIIAIYRCPGCGGTNWGPKVEAPDTWWCLDCNQAKVNRVN